VCFPSVTRTYRVPCVSSESLQPLSRIKGATKLQHPTARVCFLRVTASIPFPRIEGPTTHTSFTYITLLYDASPQQTAMASGSRGEYGCGPEFWEEQDPEFKGVFPVLHKRDFRSMREVRSYAPNKPVLWPTCSHGERYVMQVYEGWVTTVVTFGTAH
jgi:hypothetical protein